MSSTLGMKVSNVVITDMLLGPDVEASPRASIPKSDIVGIQTTNQDQAVSFGVLEWRVFPF